MKKKEICFVSGLIPENEYEHLYIKSKKPGQQIVKFNRLIVQGLINNDVSVHCLSSLVLSPALTDRKIVRLQNDALFTYTIGFNIPGLKNIHNMLASFFRILFTTRYSSCIIDPLSVDNGYGASLACRLRRIPVVSIVTDLPEHMTSSSLFRRMADSIIAHSTAYVFLTRQANDKVNTNNKPWVLVEGLVSDEKTTDTKPASHTKDIVFAGGIEIENGVKNLVEAFMAWNQDTYRLRLFGNGTYEEELKKSIVGRTDIVYEGVLLNKDLLPIMKRASLLINPRPVDQCFTDFTFPSKTIEYMSCGTYSACTHLPGIPKEYFHYIGDVGNGSVDQTLSFLKHFSEMSEEEKTTKAEEALRFVQIEKNNTVQAKKILDMIASIRRNA